MKQVTYKPLICNDEEVSKAGKCHNACVRHQDGAFYVCPALFTDK